jgi:ectoine hydroxylase-related dioxygenase (phytanoyl-CoA dioxygenase family)
MTHTTLDTPAAIPGAPPAGPVAPTQAQLDAFAAQGFLSWGPLLAPAELAELRDEYDRVFAEAERTGAYRNLSAGDRLDAEQRRAHPQQMLQIMQVCERSLTFRRLLHDPRILAIARAILGPNLMLFHDQALWKRAHTGGAVTWHQDNGYWRCAPANLISCWLTLDDAVRDNGAMQVVPGSHLAPLRHARSSETEALLEVPTPAPGSVTVVELPAGGCMVHHCQTLHYTAPNRTERQRRAFIIHFMTPGTRDRDGRVMRAGWEHPVLSMDM